MNKKTLAIGFLTAVVAGSVLLTSSVSAFWPFDSLFSKGSVKATTTDRGNFIGTEPNSSRVGGMNETFKLLREACITLRKSPNNTGRISPIKTTVGPNGAKMAPPLRDTSSVEGYVKSEMEMNSLYSKIAAICKSVDSLSERWVNTYVPKEAKVSVTPTATTRDPKEKAKYEISDPDPANGRGFIKPTVTPTVGYPRDGICFKTKDGMTVCN